MGLRPEAMLPAGENGPPDVPSWKVRLRGVMGGLMDSADVVLECEATLEASTPSPTNGRWGGTSVWSSDMMISPNDPEVEEETA